MFEEFKNPGGFDVSSMFNYGKAPTSPFTGQPDLLASIMPNTLQGMDLGGSTNATGNMFNGLSGWLEDSGFLGRTLGDGTKVQGWGGAAIGLGQGLLNGWMGMKNLGLMKDQLNFSKEQYRNNYEAQKKTTNSALEDRQRARVASNPGAYQSVGDYMKGYGI